MTAVPGTVGPGSPPRAAGRHEHLWSLPDGTGLHAPPGRLLAEEATGRLCCHLCGQWFAALGIHVRVHGHTAGTYREAMGLPRTSALAASQPVRRGIRADYPRTAPAAGTGPVSRRTGAPDKQDIQQRPADRDAAAQGGASNPDPAPRQYRSEGWTIIITAVAGGQGSDWACWLLRQARAR